MERRQFGGQKKLTIITDEMSLLINCRELGFRGIIFYNQKEKVKNIKASLILEVGVEFCEE